MTVKRESQRSIAKRFGFTQPAVNRHARNCIGLVVTQKKSAVTPDNTSDSQATRITPLDGQKSRGERFAYAVRLLNEALDLLEASKKDGDRATALKALKEARDSLALVMRAEGDLQDGGGTNIDARSVNLFPNWKPDELRALLAALPLPQKSNVV